MGHPVVISLIVGGREWTGFTRAAIAYGAKQSVRTFAFSVTDSTDPIGEQWNFMPGTPAQVLVNGQLAVNGYIHTMSPSYDGNNHHVEISGDSKSADSVKASAVHSTGEFKKKTLGAIAKELDQQGVGYEAEDDTPQIPLFRINPGESVFSAIERVARKHQRLLVGKPDGGVKIVKGGKKRVHAPIIEGVNIISASATFSDKGKNSKYTVKGQRSFGTDKKALRIEASSEDATVKRNVPRIIVNESDVRNNKRAKKRAKHHKDRAKGEGIQASISLQGALCDNGLLWEPNTLVFVDAPMLKLGMEMLISNVQIQQSSAGTKTTLTLVHPKALGSEAKTAANKPRKSTKSSNTSQTGGSTGGRTPAASEPSTEGNEWEYGDDGDNEAGGDDQAGGDEGVEEGEEPEA